MEIGNKIFQLRKEANLSQEQLEEKRNAIRQPISKWELNEITLDMKQAKQLSIIFKVSLDILTDNDINNLAIEKVNNTEKLAGLILRVAKCIGVCFL